MVYQATRVTIIAERLLEQRITDIINKAGASGYTILDGSGKGQHGRHMTKGAAVINSFSILKIEFVILDRDIALSVADEVEQTCFNNYSGIVYLSNVEIIRKERF